MTFIRNFYARLSNRTKAAINSAWQSALGSFLLLLLGFLRDVEEWAGSTDVPFPTVSTAGKALAAIVTGLAVGLVTAIYRSFVPAPAYASTPLPPPPPQG